MIRVILFLAKLALLVAAAVWLVTHKGTVNISWQDYDITTSVPVLVGLVLVFSAICVAFYALWRALVGIPQSLSLGHLSRRQRKGYMALTQGLVAIAAGNADAAQKLADKAQKYLHEPSITLLLQAQAAQLRGDDIAASSYFSSMLDKPETSFLGLRGLINHALKEGDLARALELGYKALKIQPKAGWLLSLLCDLEARSGKWETAMSLLGRAQKAKALAPDRAASVKVALWLGEAQALARLGEIKKAISLAYKAHSHMTGFAPAALLLSQLYVKDESLSKAAKTIEHAWKIAPHPALAAFYENLFSSLSLLDQVKKIDRLANLAKGATESRLAQARIAVKAGLWGVARTAVAPLLEQDALSLPALCHIMADLERSENHDTEAAEEWLKKAHQGPEPETWVCQSCGAASSDWTPICGSCQSLATQLWQSPSGKISLLPPMA